MDRTSCISNDREEMQRWCCFCSCSIPDILSHYERGYLGTFIFLFFLFEVFSACETIKIGNVVHIFTHIYYISDID